MKYYLDCEFDSHNGPLLSIALIPEQGSSLYLVTDVIAHNPWVLDHVVPHLHTIPFHSQHDLTSNTIMDISVNRVGFYLRSFLAADDSPTIVADSPVDIGRFCQAFSTGSDGNWRSTGRDFMSFEVRNVDTYPNSIEDAIQHHAWWDAYCLRDVLTRKEP